MSDFIFSVVGVCKMHDKLLTFSQYLISGYQIKCDVLMREKEFKNILDSLVNYLMLYFQTRTWLVP